MRLFLPYVKKWPSVGSQPEFECFKALSWGRAVEYANGSLVTLNWDRHSASCAESFVNICTLFFSCFTRTFLHLFFTQHKNKHLFAPTCQCGLPSFFLQLTTLIWAQGVTIITSSSLLSLAHHHHHHLCHHHHLHIMITIIVVMCVRVYLCVCVVLRSVCRRHEESLFWVLQSTPESCEALQRSFDPRQETSAVHQGEAKPSLKPV